jgi:hypothetical protein
MEAAIRRWIVAAAWTAAVAGLWAQSPPPSGVISGRVVIRGESPAAPIRRARVTLDGGAGQRVTDTDTGGRYRFAGLPPGAYRVSAAKSGFVTLFAGTGRAFVTPPPITLEAGEARTVDLALPRGAALEGRVTDADGDPIENVIVGVSRLVPTARGLRQVSLAEDWTDDLGRYRIHSLPAGAFLIQTGTSGTLSAGMASPFPSGPEAGARTYYPGTTNLSEAQIVRVAPGEERPGLDFSVRYARLSSFIVRVVDATGRAPTSVGCRLHVMGSPAYQDGVTFPNQPRCAFNQIPPGEYWAIARSGVTSSGQVGYAASRLQVAGDMGEVVLTVEGVSELAGVLEADEAAAWRHVPGMRVVAHATVFDPPSPAGQDDLLRPIPQVPSTVGPDGRFVLPGVFGPTVFRIAGLPPGWALGAVSLEGEDVTDREVNVAAGAQPRRLRLMVTNHTGKIVGTITGDVPNAVSWDTRVVAFAADERRWSGTSRYVIATVAQPDGRFAFDGLLPASYLVAAADDLDEDAWLDPAVLRELSRRATPVVVAAGETARASVLLGGAR